METTRRLRARKNPAKLIAAAVFAILVILTIVWWTSAQQLPMITVPSPKLPTPNAFDTFNSAAANFVDGSKIGYAIGTRHTGLKDDRDYTWVEKRKFVAENALTLKLLRKGLHQVYLNPPARSFNFMFPYYARYRAMARLLVLESQVKINQGDYAGATRSSMDAMDLGAQAPHGSVLIGGLVGIACQAIGRRPIWQHIDRLNVAQAREVGRRIGQIRRRQVPFAETMLEEKWCIQAGLLEVMRKPNSLGAIAQNIGSPVPAFMNSAVLSQLAFLVYSKRRIMNDYTTYIDAEIARAKLPFGTAPPPPIPNDPIVQILVPVYDQASLKFVSHEAQNGLLEIAFALRAYRVEHRAYPAALNALATAIPSERTIDPFAKGASYKYRPAGSGYILYSVGPDGTDDGGKAIDSGVSRAGNPNERYSVRADSKGDIVAAKNIW